DRLSVSGPSMERFAEGAADQTAVEDGIPLTAIRACWPESRWSIDSYLGSMLEEWFRQAKDIDRLRARQLLPVTDQLKQLKFRKDTRSGAAAAGKKRK
ncbi:MAG: hypothetical protein VX670_10560, partial [Candidatus Latescibacterota bacterium]|nr:hypothetical protein [Candidatus Latescibacterota bacterium]